MRRLRYLPAARRDLLDILTYIARQSGSLVLAQDFVARLRRQCRHLAQLPGTLGRARPELRPDIRSFPFGNYVIFFRYLDSAFEVVNILEGHRDIDRHIPEGSGDQG
ncbi:type II toxin-antitoxin system RelE/ParE family toxin [Inquilinus sp. CA228]|uniref:type II toxin-antitoxin system RelE/ParE family toxin n=1 Tax=Inquilinus sp. CA228 TaxID=3455609 RepID=UPI003F8D6AC7